ncbi:MAG: nucleoside monophosphate kinase [Patescibacteria group bacterium]
MKKHIHAVLFGPQGCGKGTQGQLLAERFDIPLIGAGDLLRDEIREKTPLGAILQSYVDSGLLAPDEVVNAVLTQRMKKLDLSRGFILDGYPRNVEQAIQLDRVLKINLAIYLKIADAEAVRRLLGRRQCVRCKTTFHLRDVPPAKPGICSVCGGKLEARADDTEEAIRKRLATFHFMTEPLVTYYRQHGAVLTVNGEQPIPYVFDDLIKKMAKLGFTS